jgi:hypothetical protein
MHNIKELNSLDKRHLTVEHKNDSLEFVEYVVFTTIKQSEKCIHAKLSRDVKFEDLGNVVIKYSFSYSGINNLFTCFD